MKLRRLGLWFVLACCVACAAGAEPVTGSNTEIADGSEPVAAFVELQSEDPGYEPWVTVPESDVLEQCKLDPAALQAADATLGVPWVAVRYGRLCHAFNADVAPREVLSATKLLGATVAGAVAHRTRELPRIGRKSGPFTDEDRVDHWLDVIHYNRDARVGHVLGMVAQSADLAFGKRVMEYDYFGIVQLDSVGVMLNAAIAQDAARLGANLDVFTLHDFFVPLGMKQSSWSEGYAEKAFAWTWVTTPLDMARLGLLILRGGMWSGRRIVDREWTYRMTHPSFEDANTGFGYCTWLNASANYTLGGQPVPPEWTDYGRKPHYPGPCAPVAIYRTHPHGLSEAPDCNYGAAYSCDAMFDAGVWQSVAGFGTVIQGHPGLDLVLVAWDLMPEDFAAVQAPGKLWDAVRPAVVAADPQFRGDEAAFCAAYGSNRYAPDLREPLP